MSVDQMTKPLQFSSCQASVHEESFHNLLAYAAQRAGIDLEYRDDLTWQERYAALDAGELDGAWICGWPYVRRIDDSPAVPIELLAAPIMADPRYQGRPVYFSEVVVRAESAYDTFVSLRGARWAFNERGSHSGCNVVGWYLATQGLTGSHFGAVIESGSHQQSLAMILASQVDSAAIDSTVLETLQKRDPTLRSRLRRIATLGPSPIPPIVIRTTVPSDQRSALRHALITLHEHPTGRDLLSNAALLRFASVTDADYNVTRQMSTLAHGVSL